MSSMPGNGGPTSIVERVGTTPSMNIARALSSSAETLQTMSPIDLFITQLSCESSEARVEAMRRLTIVAEAVGPDVTLNQLVPFLANNVAVEGDEDDEILLILGDQLARLVPSLIPGYKALPTLSILERLAGVEETVVRDQAVESMNKIISVLLPEEDVGKDAAAALSSAPALLLAMAKRLSGADWFTAKVSAAGILPTIYSFYNHKKPADNVSSNDEIKRELRILYKDLADDETPMVRRSAARHLGAFVNAVANLPVNNKKAHDAKDNKPVPDSLKKIVQDEMIPIFQSLANDEQDSVRLLAVVAAGSVGRATAMDPVKNAELVLPVVRNGCIDLSWRVRNNLAKEFTPVATSMGFAPSSPHQTELFLCFSGLLQDNEAEVRGAAVTNVARMTQLGGPDLFSTHIAPYLPSLSDDPSPEVRSRLAQNLMDCSDPSICSCLSDRIVLQVFRPLLENFLNDEVSEVRLQVLTKLDRLSNLLSKMDVVVNHVLHMTKASNWRVREAVGQLLPHLAEAMGVPFFEDHLLEPWLKLLLDKVASVRYACVNGMSKLLSVAGPHWIQSELLPQYNRIYDDSISYLTRITILRCYAELCNESSIQLLHPQLLEEVVNQMLKALKDKVANVRMISAQGLMNISELCEPALVQAKVRPALNSLLKEDEDEDCRYFAQLALNVCN